MFHNFKNTLHYQAKKSTRAFGPRCVKAESLGPEGSMIRYGTKEKKLPQFYFILDHLEKKRRKLKGSKAFLQLVYNIEIKRKKENKVE